MKTFIVGLTLAAGLLASATASAGQLSRFTVCADPGNMPLSNKKGQGFENKIGQVLGSALGTGVNFQWWPSMGRGVMRKTVGAHLCDAWLDMDPHTDGATTTVPLYRSTFVLVSRKNEHLHIKNLDDPVLQKLKIGVYQMSAIREVLSEHNVNNTQVQYVTYDGDIHPDDQPSHQVQQVADGTLDVAAIWGPMAGYYKTIKHEPLVLQPVNLMSDDIPLQFDMALALPKNHPELKAAVEKAMYDSKAAIKKVLVDYGVPLVQCHRCVISGDLPAHGPYTHSTPETTATAAPAKTSAQDDQRLADLKRWLAQGANPNHELQDAIVANDALRVNYLLKHGADANDVDNGGYTALANATRFGFDAIAEDLIAHHADVNRKDGGSWTPLMYAAWDDDAPLVRALAAKGAHLEDRDSKGMTPLAIAAQNGKTKAESALIDAGANVNQTIAGGGYTPLMLAVLSGSSDGAQRLIAHGAKVNAANPGGVTALMIATAHHDADLVRLLLKHGADPAAKTQDGRTALSIARQRNDTAMIKLLKGGKST